MGVLRGCWGAQKKHPDVLLVVEVGYKMRFFGDDAETAASVCNIMAYPDHNFLTASIPTQRLHVHVRRLVRAGHKVGLVRQTESAALKAAGNNRGTPFIRELTALLTPATLDAGDVETGGQDSTNYATGDGSTSNQLMLVLERSVLPTLVEIAILAVDCVSGCVQTATLKDGPSRSGLEAALIQIAPAELLLPDSLSPATEKLLAAWTASSSSESSIRVERFKFNK
jgi:DNA mismatch repair protein MSH3